MSMTRKDFRSLASVISELQDHRPDINNNLVSIDIVEDLITNFCQTQNRNFDKMRFHEACKKKL